MPEQTLAKESKPKKQWSKPIFGRPPIAIPEESGQPKPLLLNFVKRPDIDGPKAGGQTYLGATPTKNGVMNDYADDDR